MSVKSTSTRRADDFQERFVLKRVLFLCTGNSARSQMSEALLRMLGGSDYEVYSAGTTPSDEVNPFALKVLRQRGIDTGRLHPKKLDQFLDEEFDLVVTVCDRAKQECPVFPGARGLDHWSLEDPAAFEGTYEEVLTKFRDTRDEIENRIRDYLIQGKLYNDQLNTHHLQP
jgi:arsenate reductase